jgi:hypothetical protein
MGLGTVVGGVVGIGVLDAATAWLSRGDVAVGALVTVWLGVVSTVARPGTGVGGTTLAGGGACVCSSPPEPVPSASLVPPALSSEPPAASVGVGVGVAVGNRLGVSTTFGRKAMLGLAALASSTTSVGPSVGVLGGVGSSVGVSVGCSVGSGPSVAGGVAGSSVAGRPGDTTTTTTCGCGDAVGGSVGSSSTTAATVGTTAMDLLDWLATLSKPTITPMPPPTTVQMNGCQSGLWTRREDQALTSAPTIRSDQAPDRRPGVPT